VPTKTLQLEPSVESGGFPLKVDRITFDEILYVQKITNPFVLSNNSIETTDDLGATPHNGEDILAMSSDLLNWYEEAHSLAFSSPQTCRFYADLRREFFLAIMGAGQQSDELNDPINSLSTIDIFEDWIAILRRIFSASKSDTTMIELPKERVSSDADQYAFMAAVSDTMSSLGDYQKGSSVSKTRRSQRS
jgi:hypothetical protein